MEAYDAVKISGSWKVRALSACFPPIVLSGAAYPTKAQAMRAAKDAAGYGDITMRVYLSALADFKQVHNIA